MAAILDKIRAAKDLGEIKYRVDKWDVEFLIVEPSRRIIIDLQSQYLETDAAGNISGGDMQKFGTACLVEMLHDTDRQRVFESIEQADDVLGKKSAKVQIELIEVCQKLIKGVDKDKVEEAEGNSDGIQS